MISNTKPEIEQVYSKADTPIQMYLFCAQLKRVGMSAIRYLAENARRKRRKSMKKMTGQGDL